MTLISHFLSRLGVSQFAPMNQGPEETAEEAEYIQNYTAPHVETPHDKIVDDLARIIDPSAFRSWQCVYDYSLAAGDDEPQARAIADGSDGMAIHKARLKAHTVREYFSLNKAAKAAGVPAAPYETLADKSASYEKIPTDDLWKAANRLHGMFLQDGDPSSLLIPSEFEDRSGDFIAAWEALGEMLKHSAKPEYGQGITPDSARAAYTPTLSQGDEDRIWNEAQGAAAECVPTTWLDQLLSGKKAIKFPAGSTPAVEKLLLALRERVRSLKRPTASGSSSPTPGENAGCEDEDSAGALKIAAFLKQRDEAFCMTEEQTDEERAASAQAILSIINERSSGPQDVVEALKWALPLASQYQAFVAGERAKAGHTNLGTKFGSLYDSEVESEEKARAALASLNKGDGQ